MKLAPDPPPPQTLASVLRMKLSVLILTAVQCCRVFMVACVLRRFDFAGSACSVVHVAFSGSKYPTGCVSSSTCSSSAVA